MKELKLFCLFPTTVGHFSEAIKLTEAEKNYIQKQQTRLNLGGGGNEHTVDTYVLDKKEFNYISSSNSSWRRIIVNSCVIQKMPCN